MCTLSADEIADGFYVAKTDGMHYVYVLESELDADHWYVGVTNNLVRRLAEHNTGLSTHTSRFRPWVIKNYIAFRDRPTAERFERYLKSHSGRAFVKKYF